MLSCQMFHEWFNFLLSNIETESLKNYDINRILQDVVSDHVHRADSPSLTLILDMLIPSLTLILEMLIQLIVHGI
ncbi:hypothetical protein RHMOL_Rhmol04G0257300 [Rhododendron molle]|uniref:Uncharacterized protein n=1 Tax=Rhododendron molle TaxID=49168 RepID=A0ACC0P5P7_RHOML|nr:hypothetical protein RHMOL_Rhmol04G0257300 [Rhododendron molle]